MGKRLIALCVGSALVLISSFLLVRYYKQSLLLQAQKNIEVLANDRRQKLMSYFDTRVQQLEKVAAMSKTIETLEQLLQASPAEKADVQKKYADFLDHETILHEFAKLFLISIKGDVVFARQSGPELRANVVNGPLSTTALGQSFARVIMVLAPDIVGTAYYPPTKKAALFVAVPLFSKNVLKGVLAVQLTFDSIFTIVQDSTGLGKTGETVLAENINNEIFFISNVRHNPTQESEAERSHVVRAFTRALQGQKVSLNDNRSHALYHAALGIETSGIALDYRGVPAIAVGKYIPQASWGMTTKIDVAEVLKPVHSIEVVVHVLAFITFLLFLYLFLLLFLGSTSALPERLFALVFCVSLTFLLYVILSYVQLQKHTQENINQEAEQIINQKSLEIEQKLAQISYIAQSLAHDLSTGSLAKEDIHVALTRELRENPELASLTIAYVPDKHGRLSAPSVIRSKNVEAIDLATLYNYTKPLPQNPTKTAWYLKGLKGPRWTDNYIQDISHKVTSVYSVPFYTNTKPKKVAGVVALAFELGSLRQAAASTTIGKSSYGLLLTNKGVALFYPVESYVEQKNTLAEIALKTHNPILTAFAEKLRSAPGQAKPQAVPAQPLQIAAGQPKAHQPIPDQIGPIATSTEKKPEPLEKMHVFDEAAKKMSWIYYKKVPFTDWMLALVFDSDDFAAPARILYNYLLLILLFLTLTCMAGAFFFYSHKKMHALAYSMTSSALFAVALLCTWLLIEHKAIALRTPVMITDQVSLNKFVGSLEDMAQQHHYPQPITIETAIVVHFFDATKPDHITFVGEVWQKYDEKKHAGIARSIRFPQATKSTITQIEREKTGTIEIIRWSVNCELFQKVSIAHYPFDIKHIEIVMDHPEKAKNIVLVPLLNAYHSLRPTSIPGVALGATVAGFYTERSFFNYTTIDETTISAEAQPTPPSLTFNVLLKRGLLNSFIIQLLPLIIILISLFAANWLRDVALLEEKGAASANFRAMSVYTALFFSLILMHRSLRSDFPVGEILYIEYLFFFTYLSILCLSLYTIVISSHEALIKKKEQIALVNLTYWPIEIGLWFIATILLFYKF